jgi:hypothetical protein
MHKPMIYLCPLELPHITWLARCFPLCHTPTPRNAKGSHPDVTNRYSAYSMYRCPREIPTGPVFASL